MKRSNLVTFVVLSVVIIAAIIAVSRWKIPLDDDFENDFSLNETSKVEAIDKKSPETEKQESEDISFKSEDTTVAEIEAETTHFETEIVAETELETEALEEKKVSLKGEALFIGDSRTVGLMEYANIEDADFFCTEGMSVFNIHKKSVPVAGIGKITLDELLKEKKYDRIYVMLGINEVGYKSTYIVSKYGELINMIQTEQADSKIVIQANLHVTKIRSDSDKIINNNAINCLNAELAKLADGVSRFYLDANVLFDDINGSLSVEKSIDSAHLYAKYYQEWGKWIALQTASLFGEGEI